MTRADDGRTVSLIVPEEAVGTRLDQYLAARLGGPSRAQLRRWIDEGRVLVDGRPASKPGVTLRRGMRLQVDIPPASPIALAAEAIEVDVLHEDDAILVVNKRAGLAVHPGHGLPSGTLVNALLGRGIRLSSVGLPDRPGIVHRLDRDTSGALVVAKTDLAHRVLAAAFAQRQVRKVYRALVWGHPRPADGRVEQSIGRSRNDPTRMTVGATRGRRRHATTRYRTLEALTGFAWLELHLETGRTHQIRVHMQAIHHPIVGDRRYGGRAWRGVQHPRKRKALRTFERLALHAARLSFHHPTTGRQVDVTAPLPVELDELLDTLREDA